MAILLIKTKKVHIDFYVSQFFNTINNLHLLRRSQAARDTMKHGVKQDIITIMVTLAIAFDKILPDIVCFPGDINTPTEAPSNCK